MSPGSRSRVRVQWSTLLCKGNALAQAELSWASERLEHLLAFGGDAVADAVQPRTPPKPHLPTSVAAVREVSADVDTPAVQPAAAQAPRRVAVRRAAPASRRAERPEPRFEVDVPVSIRLTLDLMHPLRSLSTAASCVTRAAAATLVVGTPARRPPVVPPTPDAVALAAATVDSPAQPRSRTSSISPSAAPASAAKAHARISEIEDRCAFDELILNQQRCLHGELSARVAQLEAKHREDALERQARLAQLERENELDKRLLAVELITAASPVAPSPSRGVALLRRAAAPPPRAPPNTPGTLARALSNATLAGLPEEAPGDLALVGWPLLTSPGASSASSSSASVSASPSSGSSLFYSAPDVMPDDEEEENTPPPDGTPTPARPMAALRLARSASVASDRSGASCDSASGASPAWGVMRQIPSFGGSQQATPRSVRRTTPRRTTSASPATLAAAAQECTPASERPRRTSPTCGCRSPDSPADSPTIHAETCAGQASVASKGKPPLPLRRAFSTPPVAALAQLSPA